MLYKDVTRKDVAEKTGISLRTLQRRFENPSSFTIDEIIKISEMLNIKLEFAYNTTPIQSFINPIPILPPVKVNDYFCEGCWHYEQRKNSNKIEIGDNPCSWCPKLQISCDATNNGK